MGNKSNIFVLHSSHLDLYWIGEQADCLEIGSKIIDDAVTSAAANENMHFLIETVRFLEYYIDRHPDKKDIVRKLFLNRQLEIGACYTDRLENTHDGESLVRNVTYGKRILSELLGIDTQITVHSDLPGLAEQSPQIFKKAGVNYYLFSRGFKYGARFYWKGLDTSKIIAYNFPVHYSYYNIEGEIIPYLKEIKESILAEDILISCSAGDLGDFNTFVSKEDGKWQRVNVGDLLEYLNKKYNDLNFKVSSAVDVLKNMDNSLLEVKSGEFPSRWGHNASALHVKLYQLDKKVTSQLIEAEKYSAICELLNIPVLYSEPNNPLKHKGGSGGKRRYYDLKMAPGTTKEWIDYAWRLQLVTQDHNYGGVGGAQTNFDRNMYKQTALYIANKIKDLSLEKLCSIIKAEKNSVIVFNSMNWKRSDIIYFEANDLDDTKHYVLKDNENNVYPIVNLNQQYCAYVENIPSFGYKAFRIEEGLGTSIANREIFEKDDFIILKNKYYEISINKIDGTFNYIKDLELGIDLTRNEDFLEINAFLDNSVGVAEREVNKELLDSSRKHVRSVRIIEDNCLWTKVLIETEICNAKIRLEISLIHVKKQIRIRPTLYWPGVPNVQIKMKFNFINNFKKLFYAVPYGVQEYGRYLADSKIFAPDEISDELYMRYREVQGWLSLNGDKASISLSSDHSAFDINYNEVNDLSVILLRDVRSGGDEDVWFLNEGELKWDFSISSYIGMWNENESYKDRWEMLYPLEAKIKVNENDGAVLPYAGSFITTEGNCILTVFKKSDYYKDNYIVRVFNTTDKESLFKLSSNITLFNIKPCDLNEKDSSEAVDVIHPYEIKSLKLWK
ncbi:Alpha-mannosidase [Caldanaerobius fijiensis DSM 17918]|uniref:Alpha-mannosidase n=1 Tax=Caldanaerobius fijiensis DSM 17918 TaxID=1121256 RepID=A0A1M4SBP7_9THEO|nr:glycosyl hydrolase-related protein [Caldanaerobius fijiensis]SHE29626.1 Alpha-mannosidase [Caldanaerobius fijiensis DSM 17918]